MNLRHIPPKQVKKAGDQLDLLIEQSFSAPEALDRTFNAGVWAAVDRTKYGSLRTKETCGLLSRSRRKGRRLAVAVALLALVAGFTAFRQPVVTALSSAMEKVEVIIRDTGGREKFSVITRFFEKKNIHGPDAEYGPDGYAKFLADMKKLPVRLLLPPKYIPDAYRYSDAHYYFSGSSSVLEGDLMFTAERHSMELKYRAEKSIIFVRQDSNIKKGSMFKVPAKDLLNMQGNQGKIILDDGYKLSKVSIGQTEAVKAIKITQETTDIQLIVPLRDGDIGIWYNAKTKNYNALSDTGKQAVDRDLIKIASSMLE